MESIMKKNNNTQIGRRNIIGCLAAMADNKNQTLTNSTAFQEVVK